MLKLENITVAFGSHVVLNSLSCTIENGDFVVIVGANGAGKSTFFDLIAGKTKPTQGRITLDDVDITRLDEVQRAPLISRLFQNTKFSVVPSMTVAENLAMALYKSKPVGLTAGMGSFPKEIVENLLKPLNLENFLDKSMGMLSGGQRQMIAFIMATLQPPRLLLLDEPTAALDPASATKLLTFATNYLKKHSITTLLITHDPNLALALGNKLWVLENGNISKKFGAEEKNRISPENLVGHIDYSALKAH